MLATYFFADDCNVSQCTAASDVYSLGMVLYYMVYRGQLPFHQIEDIALLTEEILNSSYLLYFISFSEKKDRSSTVWKKPRYVKECFSPSIAIETLMRSLLLHDPRSRPTLPVIVEAYHSFDFHLQHPEWFKTSQRKRKLSIEYPQRSPASSALSETLYSPLSSSTELAVIRQPKSIQAAEFLQPAKPSMDPYFFVRVSIILFAHLLIVLVMEFAARSCAVQYAFHDRLAFCHGHVCGSTLAFELERIQSCIFHGCLRSCFIQP